MSITATQIVARAKRVYGDIDGTPAMEYLNDVDEEVLAVVPWRRNSRAIALVAGTREYALAETEIKVWVARLLQNGNFGSERHLEETSMDTLDGQRQGWRAEQYQEPRDFYVEVNATTGVLGLYPTPDVSSLTVSGATAATPIVITTQTHGLADGDAVVIQGVSGVPEANGRFYAKVTGYSTTTFALYSDSDLATAVAGTGAYVSGGVMAAPSQPMLVIEFTEKLVYTGSENFPTTPHLRDLYVVGICRRFAMDRDHEKLGHWDNVFNARLAAFSQQYWGRSAKFRPALGPALTQMGGYRR